MVRKSYRLSSKPISATAGFTLIELLIGIILTSMIFLASSAVIVALFNSNIRLKQLDTLEQAKNDLLNEFSNTLKWAKTITLSPTQDQISGEDAEGHAFTYRYDPTKKQLLRDNQALTGLEVAVTGFTVTDYSINKNGTAPVSLEINIELESAKFTPIKDRMRIVVSQRVSIKSNQ